MRKNRVIIVDFHAEATQKKWLGEVPVGRVSAVVGTHTHVQTADEKLPGGAAYITDHRYDRAYGFSNWVKKDVVIRIH